MDGKVGRVWQYQICDKDKPNYTDCAYVTPVSVRIYAPARQMFKPQHMLVRMHEHTPLFKPSKPSWFKINWNCLIIRPPPIPPKHTKEAYIHTALTHINSNQHSDKDTFHISTKCIAIRSIQNHPQTRATKGIYLHAKVSPRQISPP